MSRRTIMMRIMIVKMNWCGKMTIAFVQSKASPPENGKRLFKDFSPLIVFVHNRYRRPLENERMRDELEKAVNIIWNCRLPSPRCVAIDAVVELDLVSALQVSIFPELIFTKAGKILYCEEAIQTADELSKIMAFFYYGAAKLPSLNTVGKSEEPIPTI